MIACSICKLAVWNTPSGTTCPNEHGGAPTIDIPDDPTLEVAQRMGHLAQLRAHVEAGGALDRGNALWLIEAASGGVWGRLASQTMTDARDHRRALRELVRALVTPAGLLWRGGNWRPIIQLLAPRANDDVTLPDLRRLDCGVRLIEPGESG